MHAVLESQATQQGEGEQDQPKNKRTTATKHFYSRAKTKGGARKKEKGVKEDGCTIENCQHRITKGGKKNSQ